MELGKGAGYGLSYETGAARATGPFRFGNNASEAKWFAADMPQQEQMQSGGQISEVSCLLSETSISAYDAISLLHGPANTAMS